MRRLVILFSAVVLSLIPAGHALADPHHAQVQLHTVGSSGVSGFVNLEQRPHERGTHINVMAFGLMPGHQYVSLYYGNHRCDLEPYSANDVIGGMYRANGGGVGTTRGNADDDLDEINSVSVRDADNFNLLACADVHPH